MGNEAAYDQPNTEPLEKLPVLGIGDYKIRIDKAEYRQFKDLLVLEVTPTEASKDAQTPVGERCVHYLNLKVTSKVQGTYVARRVKGFVYPVLGRDNMTGGELVEVTEKTPEIFVGTSARVAVKEQRDKDTGELKKDKKSGKVYLEAEFSAA